MLVKEENRRMAAVVAWCCMAGSAVAGIAGSRHRGPVVREATGEGPVRADARPVA
jgi:hypothetical protein